MEKNLMEVNLQSYREHIAVVPQQSILFSGTIRDNITYGTEGIPDEKLWEIVRAANLEDVIKKNAGWIGYDDNRAWGIIYPEARNREFQLPGHLCEIRKF